MNSETALRNAQFDVSGRISFLIGVEEKHISRSEDVVAIYRKLECDQQAKLIRNLCLVRSALMRHYYEIYRRVREEAIGYYQMGDLIPLDAVDFIEKYRVNSLRQPKCKPIPAIIEINKVISDRINNLKFQFPIDVDWKHIRDLFLMPDGYSKNGVLAALRAYHDHLTHYPYQLYINVQIDQQGNILYDDEALLKALSHKHDEAEPRMSDVKDMAAFTKDKVLEYLKDPEGVEVVVDCENADPYKLCAAIRSLNAESSGSVRKIILYDDEHTSTAWERLEEYLKIPVEYNLVERLKEKKSLVDTAVTAGVCKEHYLYHVRRFILVASDSDYWSLIKALPTAEFLVMAEREGCGAAMKEALREHGIFYCFTDDFYTGGSADIKYNVILDEVAELLHSSLDTNLRSLLDQAIVNARAPMNEAETNQLYDRYLRKLSMDLSSDGSLKFSIPKYVPDVAR